MNDKKLIQLVAELWVENGGDAEGFNWNALRIRDEIVRVSNEKDTHDD